MPRYELSLICKTLSKGGLATVLRRYAKFILDKGGVVRKMENLGEAELPYKINIHGETHNLGRYFLMDIDLSPEVLAKLRDEMRTDVDLIRPRLIKTQARYDSMKRPHYMTGCWQSFQPPGTRKR